MEGNAGSSVMVSVEQIDLACVEDPHALKTMLNTP